MLNKKTFFLSIVSVLFFIGAFFTPSNAAQAITCMYELEGETQCFLYPTTETEDRKVSVDVTELRTRLQPLTNNLNNIQPSDLNAFCQAICAKQGVNCRLDEARVSCDGGPDVPENYHGPLPDCAFSKSGCLSVDSFVVLAVNIGRIIFSFLGSIAFVMFIYGGVVMVVSFGNPEKFKQGQKILGAAVVGVLIALSAYLAIDFILDTLQVEEGFRGVNL